jgi:formylglycine-generating enzyme required for sulfatase activity
VPEGGQTFDVPAFAMAKYPITNAQFDVFARAKDGYRDAMWWDYSDEAKAWRKKNVTPKDPAFGGVGDHPRANVCWYEAAAFCRWLNWKSLTLNPSPFDGEGRRGGEVITLPTEQQWQRAAQGDDGREYPWGSTFDAKRCNTLESGIRQTTPVTAYPDGASPFGVMDMAGNVWEWCLTDYNTGANDLTANSSWRVLRGCSFMRDRYRATVLYRIYYGDDPFYGDYWFGFRVACGGVPS